MKNRWKMGKCEEPTGLALDEKNRRLFAGCSNKEMAIMDADSGKVIAELPVGDYVDATAFDTKLGLAFSSNGDGTLTIVREENPNKFSVVQTVLLAVLISIAHWLSRGGADSGVGKAG